MNDTSMELEIYLACIDGGEIDVAELGVFLTGINRWVNHAGSDRAVRTFSAHAREPRNIRLNISDIKSGSVTIDAVVQFVGANIGNAWLIQGLFGSALYDGVKLFAHSMRRAFSRVPIAGAQLSKTFRITVKTKNQRMVDFKVPTSVGCTVTVHPDGRVEVKTDPFDGS